MKIIAWMFALVFCFRIIPTVVPTQTALAAPQQQFVFCYSASIDPDVAEWYYTDVFRGEAANGRKYSDSFFTYIRETFPDKNPGPAGCRYYNSEYNAKSDKRTLQAASNARSVETGWTYSY
jgi:hypothetical protein